MTELSRKETDRLLTERVEALKIEHESKVSKLEAEINGLKEGQRAFREDVAREKASNAVEVRMALQEGENRDERERELLSHIREKVSKQFFEPVKTVNLLIGQIDKGDKE